MRRLLTLALTLVLAAAVANCSDGDESDAGPSRISSPGRARLPELACRLAP